MNKIRLARKLRRQQTETERLLWSLLRSRQICGYKIRRQIPIGNYIVDFVCFERKVVIEVDGSQHAEQQKRDKEREDYLRGRGFRVIRFWDTEVLCNIEGVLEVIEKNLLDHPHLISSPVEGEEDLLVEKLKVLSAEY